MENPPQKTPSPALFDLALRTAKRDPLAAANLMRKAAELGCIDAALWLAAHLLHGRRIAANPREAFRWLEMFSRRDGFPPHARLLLGCCLYEGLGTVADPKAAVQALHDALRLSGRDRWGVPVVDDGNSLSETDVRKVRLILGECYYYGKGVEKDYCRALKYLLLAVREGEYLYPNPKAEYLIGTCYYFHRGTRQDIPQALFWLNHAAEGGSDDAARLLAGRVR